MEFSKADSRYGKITIPPGFGLIPEVIEIPVAIDAERRNCYLKDGELLPFDVILRHPGAALRNYLNLH